MAPVLALDVDGVVNCDAPRGWGRAPRQASAYAYGQRWRMRWAPTLTDQLGAWHREGRLELRWATTWCPFAGQLEALWGFPTLQRCLTDEEAAAPPDASDAAKLRAALAILDSGRELIWADDTAIPDDADMLARLQPPTPRSLLIKPTANRGLTRSDLDRIRTFLDATT
ncbi:hypothetical protein [Nocardioides sp. CER19]|uniref:hypothetical protein n=1 Tax=Nocardioides sp. CER19 TaxID=3038538 RepID=UPI00244813A9|nr:hypothetical protein [Nocardioides sp. CER19]MDH2415289.1 hypothetical protein [Nocardioides sp. CER19]